jgi:D-methionine transport system permease protein
MALYATRAGSLFPNRVVFGILNVIVNTFRPIPFIILLAAVQPVARGIGLPGIGVPFAIFAITIASLFAISRIVEQNLLTVRPGVIEAARAAERAGRGSCSACPARGARPARARLHLRRRRLVDMTAMAGAIAAGGLGEFAINYGSSSSTRG